MAVQKTLLLYNFVKMWYYGKHLTAVFILARIRLRNEYKAGL